MNRRTFAAGCRPGSLFVLGLAAGAFVAILRATGRWHWRLDPAERVGALAAVAVAAFIGCQVHRRWLLPQMTNVAGLRGRIAAVGLLYVGLAQAAAAGSPASFGPALLVVAGLIFGCVLSESAATAVDGGAGPVLVATVAAALGLVAAVWAPQLLVAFADYPVDHVWALPQVDAASAVTYGVTTSVLPVLGLTTIVRDATPEAARDRANSASTLGVPHTVAPQRADAVLRADGLDVSYGSVQILFGTSLEVCRGEAVALLGTNGAGKSTLLRAVTGLTSATHGDVWFDGEDCRNLSAEARARRGMVMVPGGRGVFPTLTVLDNLRLASHRLPPMERRRRYNQIFDAFPQLAPRQRSAAGLLSGGEQQMLALSRAWLTNPKVLLIDELSLGLAPTVVEQLVANVRRIAETGVGILLVDQSIDLALQLCDRAYFLERGMVCFDGETAGLRERPDLLRSVFLRTDDGDAELVTT